VAGAGTRHDGQPLELAVSIGMALFPQDATELDGLFEFADRAMYELNRRNKAERAISG
jgi:GGDEF domain-containing protein